MKIEFIIPSYNRPEKLMCTVSSIVAQTNPNWKLHIIDDYSTEVDKIKKIEEFFKEDDRIKWTYLDTNYNNWGHHSRQIGMDQSTEEWVIMTGNDNYYVPEFVDIMLNESKGYHFVYCDMVHNWINKEYIPIDSKLELGRIDIGNFMIKSNMGKKIRLIEKENWADWYFVRDFMSTFKAARINKIKKVLYVHN
jgi:glycosyltransferase involved in cell wall biosynthesis